MDIDERLTPIPPSTSLFPPSARHLFAFWALKILLVFLLFHRSQTLVLQIPCSAKGAELGTYQTGGFHFCQKKSDNDDFEEGELVSLRMRMVVDPCLVARDHRYRMHPM